MDNMKNCPQCGKSIIASAKFCGNCGYQFPAITPVAGAATANASQPQPTPVQSTPVQPTPVQPTPVQPTPVQPTPVQPSMGQPTPVQPKPVQATPVQPSMGQPTPVQPTPVQPSMGQPTPVQPTPVQPSMGQPTPVQPSMGQPTPMPNPMPTMQNNMAGQPKANTYQQPIPQEPKKKSGIGVIIAIIAVLIVAAGVLVAGFVLGWFSGEKKVMELSEAKVTVAVEDEVTVEITNYDDLDKPKLTCVTSDEAIATVDSKDGVITITGVTEGKTEVTISAKGCEDATCKVTVEEAAPAVDSSFFNDTAWSAGGMELYFVGSSDFYLLYADSDDYIKGSITWTEMSEDDAIAASSAFSGLIEDGVYFKGSVDVETELFYGQENDPADYYIIACTNGTDCAFYDSSWENTNTASSITMLDTDTLDSYFDVTTVDPSQNPSGGSTPTYSTGTIPGLSMGTPANSKASSFMCVYDGAVIFIGNDGNLYAIDESDLSSGSGAMLLQEADASKEFKLMAVYGDYLFFGIGYEGEAVDTFYKFDFASGSSTELASGITMSNFIVYGDTIFYTDYTNLYAMDFDGNEQKIWDSGCYTFEVANDYIFIYSTYEWEVLDAYTYEDLGWMVQDINQAYDSDTAYYQDDYILYTAYEYDLGEIALYGMDMDGNTIQISDSYYGSQQDTYNFRCDGKYAYFTIDDRETLVRVDIQTGDTETVSFSDFDNLWYSNESFMLDGQVAFYCYDYNDEGHYVTVDDNMNLTIVEAMDK